MKYFFTINFYIMNFFSTLASCKKRFSDSAIQRFSDLQLNKWLYMLFFASLLVLSSCNNQDSDKENVKQDSVSGLNTDLKLRSDVCYEELLENQCVSQVPYFEEQLLDEIPGYPADCTFKVKVKILNCDNPMAPGSTQFFTLSFEVIEVNCPQYDFEVNEILFNPGINVPTVEDYMTVLYEKLYRRFEDVYFDDFKIAFLCPGATNKWFYITHIRESCSRFCVYLTGREGNYIATPIPCGAGCCKTESRMCFNRETGKIEKTTTTTPLTQNQCDPPSPDTPFGCFIATPCKFICTQ